MKKKNSVKEYTLDPIMSIEASNDFEGKLLTEKDCDMVIDHDADVYDKETGNCIAKFRKGVIGANIMKVAYESLLIAATPTDSRGVAAGKDEEGYAKKLRVNKDGRVSKQNVSHIKINSGVAGYVDRSPRFPHCRLTAFTKHHMEKFIAAYPIFKLVDSYYKKLMPKHYKKQRAVADATPKDWVIPDTAFSTITVNKNWQTAVHKDVGDFEEGFGNLVALRKGKFTGCHFVVVRWGVGFDLQNGDLLLVDVHQWHGNTPMIKADKGATRLSLVMYYRKKMINCLPAKQEIKRVRTRKKGEAL